jgi:hypothetical protein
VQSDFRQFALDRLRANHRAGLHALARYDDHPEPIDAASAFSELLTQARIESQAAGTLAAYLANYPRLPLPNGAHETFFWLQTFHTPRPTIQALHSVVRRFHQRDLLPDAKRLADTRIDRSLPSAAPFATGGVDGLLDPG